MTKPDLILALEGGGTRSQAALLDPNGTLLASAIANDVNTNFTTIEMVKVAVRNLVNSILQNAGQSGERVKIIAVALPLPEGTPEMLKSVCPSASLWHSNERDVVFARAGEYFPHGIGIVASTGATGWGIRRDDGREVSTGGWGSLLGDEGSAYAVGLNGLRAAGRSWEGREVPSLLVDALCEHFSINRASMKGELVRLAYHKPISRVEIAGFARVVSRTAAQGDELALRIIHKAANDLAGLGLNVAGLLFTPEETFCAAVSGGLFNAGEILLAPLRQRLQDAYPHIIFKHGSEDPSVALARLAQAHNPQ